MHLQYLEKNKWNSVAVTVSKGKAKVQVTQAIFLDYFKLSLINDKEMNIR